MKSKSQKLQSRKTRSLMGGGAESLGVGCCAVAKENAITEIATQRMKESKRDGRIDQSVEMRANNREGRTCQIRTRPEMAPRCQAPAGGPSAAQDDLGRIGRLD